MEGESCPWTGAMPTDRASVMPVAVRKLAVCRQAMPRPFGLALRVWNKLARIMIAIFWPPEEAPVDPLAPKTAPAATSSSGIGSVRGEA